MSTIVTLLYRPLQRHKKTPNLWALIPDISVFNPKHAYEFRKMIPFSENRVPTFEVKAHRIDMLGVMGKIF